MLNTRKNLSAEERKVVTVEAVVELAAKQNPSSITTAAIAKQMSLTQGALFRHFSNKEAIWQAVMEWVSNRLLSRVKKAAANALNPLAALEAVFMTHVDFIVAHPGVPRMLFGELQRVETTPAKKIVHLLLKKYGLLISSLIEEGKKQNMVAAEIDVSAASIMFIGSIQGLVMQSMLSDDVNLMKDNAEGIFKLFSKSIEKKL
ncbi:MAG: TetR/AcrR family transcriptional regulator [Rhizobiales bacterium]|nr:TetR/AcrR family transcriptional regulator [Hyphomicrobiales bacterium]NRB15886.1 TetR/AcrR family transcriptional regulator [Hyphomicrobiales bacterium]